MKNKLVTSTLILGLIAGEAWSSREREREVETPVVERSASQVGTVLGSLAKQTTQLGTISKDIGSIAVAISGSNDPVSEGLKQRVEAIEKLVGHPAVIQEPQQQATLDLEGVEEAEPITLIIQATGLYLAGLLTTWRTQANEMANAIYEYSSKPLNLRWARPAIVAFLVAKIRTQSTMTNPSELDGSWITNNNGTSGPWTSSLYHCTIRYRATRGSTTTGWVYVARTDPTNITYAAAEPTPVLAEGQEAIAMVRSRLTELERNTIIQPDSELHILAHDGRAQPSSMTITDSLDTILASISNGPLRAESEYRAGGMKSSEPRYWPTELLWTPTIDSERQPYSWVTHRYLDSLNIYNKLYNPNG
ncbi:MAG: hypothetical protein LBJ69_00725 [Holosporales bacterium]|nr:hypothetical protein [Holosporales bacterium]